MADPVSSDPDASLLPVTPAKAGAQPSSRPQAEGAMTRRRPLLMQGRRVGVRYCIPGFSAPGFNGWLAKRDLAGAVLELPRRIGEDSREFPQRKFDP